MKDNLSPPGPTQYLERPDGRVAYEVRGQGPLVVCAPSVGDVRSVYTDLASLLAGHGYTVALMDLRGQGESDGTFHRYDDQALGEDMLALVERLGGRAVLVANASAAAAAVWAAAAQPARVAGLVLLAPTIQTAAPPILERAAMWVGFLKPWGPRAWSAYYRTLYPGRPPSDLQEHRAAIRSGLRLPGHWAAMVALTRASHQTAAASLAKVRTRCLVIMGAKDREFRAPVEEARRIAKTLQARTVIVPHAGHFPQAEYPEVVGPEVVQFLGKTKRRGGGW